MFERAAYYGFRAFIIMYAIEYHGFSRSNALYLYGAMTTATYFAMLPAGIIGDLLRAHKWLILVGGILQISSMFFLMSSEKHLFYAGGLMFAIGSGIYTTTSVASFGRSYFGNLKKIFSGWTFYYIMINLGAFLGIWFTESLTDNLENPEHIFYYCMILFAMGTGIAFFNMPKVVATQKKKSVSLEPRVAIFMVSVLSVALFWFSFESIGGTISLWSYEVSQVVSNVDPLFILDLNSYSIFAFGTIFFLLFAFFKSSTLRFISVAFFVGIISLLLLQMDVEMGRGLYYLIIVHTVLFTLAECLLMPAFLTIQTLYSNPRYLGIVYGASMLAMALLNRYAFIDYQPFIYSLKPESLVYLLSGCMAVIAIVFLVIHFFDKDQFVYEKKEEELKDLDLKEGEILD